MPVQVYGCNHIVIEVTDAKKAVKFYEDVFGLHMLRGGEGAAWCKLGEHQFPERFGGGVVTEPEAGAAFDQAGLHQLVLDGGQFVVRVETNDDPAARLAP